MPPTMIGTQVCITQRYIFYFLLKEKFFFINCVHCFLKWIISFPTCIHSKTEISLNRSYIRMHSDVSSIQPSASILLVHLYKSRAHINSPIKAVVIYENSANTGVKTSLVCEMCMSVCVCACMRVHRS